MIGVLEGHDHAVAAWAFQQFKVTPVSIDRCFGLIDPETQSLVGAVMFHSYNGCNVEVSYYGPKTMTLGIYKFMATKALDLFRVERVTFHVPRNRKRLIAWHKRMGAVHEGNERRFYGRDDSSASTGVRLAIFADRIRQILRRTPTHIESGLSLH